jgi:glucose uptake protein GlcU
MGIIMHADSVLLTIFFLGAIALIVFGCYFINKKDKEWKKKNPNQIDMGLSILCIFFGPIGWVYLIARHDILELLKNNHKI